MFAARQFLGGQQNIIIDIERGSDASDDNASQFGHQCLAQRTGRMYRPYGVWIRTTEELVALAVQRGCIQYQNGIEVPFVPEEELPNEKLVALLLSGSQSYNPRLIRAGAQLLSDPCNQSENVGL